MQLVDQMAFVYESLKQASEKVLAYENGRSHRLTSTGWSLMWMWRASQKRGRISCIEVYLSKGSSASGDFSRVSLRGHGDRIGHMTKLIGRTKAKSFSKDMEHFLELARRAVRWVNAFPGDDLGVLIPKSKAYGLEQWMASIAEACERRSSLAAGEVERFLSLEEEIDNLVFEFNEARQPVRFRSIICRRECPPLDPLSPAEPRYRVVEFFDRRTGRRSSRDVASYKRRLAEKKAKDRLKGVLGRDPNAAEIEELRTTRSNRKPSPWLTEEIIAHCHLGRHSGSINNHQKRMAAILEDWGSSRALIRALLL